MTDLSLKAQAERERHELLHGRGPWPPVLPPADVSIETMIEWHSKGCEWPVGGDETAISLSIKNNMPKE